jgi:hypothetical protein
MMVDKNLCDEEANTLVRYLPASASSNVVACLFNDSMAPVKGPGWSVIGPGS